jgi:eukaryotic-like serine/threonine-protein kinase
VSSKQPDHGDAGLAVARERLDSEEFEISVVTEVDTVAEEPLVGEPFGKYTLVGELATGGMAEIYLGVQRGVAGYLKVVTIKRVLPHLNNSPEFISMFIDEARLGARLEHPNIVRTYEFGEHDGQYFTVMEYLPGEDVTKLLNRAAATKQAVPLNLAVYIIMQVCSGLHFAHELTDTEGNPIGLVHRDVNPSNIIITYSGEVKVIDFGVAKTNTNVSQTLAGTIKGKLAYMAPEQVLGHGVDRRADVFSTGVVLWELLTSRPLFARDNEAATLYSVLNDPIPSVRQFRPDTPRELDAMVARALERDPADRFESCETMLFALEQFLGTQPKIDGRGVARVMEQTFGHLRANAKRSIAQTRSIQKNASLVMKLRTDVRRDLAEEAAAVNEAARYPADKALIDRRLLAAGAFVLAAGAIGASLFLLRGGDASSSTSDPLAARASLQLESEPPGAAIFFDREPTGLSTPATLDSIPVGTVAIRLELAGHVAIKEMVEIRPGERNHRKFALRQERGRIVLSGLPEDAQLWIDGEERLVGEVIPVSAGRHRIRIVRAGMAVIEQTLETTTGDQVWELQADTLVRR